ncbi:1702_t:CDS:1, partial [Racocetra fulgida]
INANLEHLQNCTSKSVSDTVLNSIINHGLDPKKCLAWVTDNTAYMS